MFLFVDSFFVFPQQGHDAQPQRGSSVKCQIVIQRVGEQPEYLFWDELDVGLYLRVRKSGHFYRYEFGHWSGWCQGDICIGIGAAIRIHIGIGVAINIGIGFDVGVVVG